MKKGFTLIEILVVVVIMGILAAVAVPKLFGNVERAKIASDIVALDGIYKSVFAASLDDSFRTAFENGFEKNANGTLKNAAKVMRMRISWAVTNQSNPKYPLHKAVVDAILANAGKEFIELGGGTSYNSDGKVPTFYRSALLQGKKLDMMVLIVETNAHFKILVFPTDSNGSSGTVDVFTYGGKPVAAGDIPQNGEKWGNLSTKVSFKYVPLEK